MTMMWAEKRCAWCQEMKRWDDFRDDRRNPRVLRKAPYCRPCSTHLSRERKRGLRLRVTPLHPRGQSPEPTEFECRKCGVTKPRYEFRDTRSRNGKLYRRGQCRACDQVSWQKSLLKIDWENPPATKRCARCRESKPWDDFATDGRTDGVRRKRCYCKACRNAISSESYRLRPEPHRRSARKAMLKASYGLTPEIYELLLREQGGGCAICGSKSPGGQRRYKSDSFAVDHDAVTGKVRGLLCGNCNRALGGFRHIPKFLRKAARYLEQPPAAKHLEPLPDVRQARSQIDFLDDLERR